MDDESRKALETMAKGKAVLKYPERLSGFVWVKQDEFERWNEQEKYRFQTSVDERVAVSKKLSAHTRCALCCLQASLVCASNT